MFFLATIWSISLFIFKFYGTALLSTEDAGAKARIFALPVGLSPLAMVMGNVYVFSRIKDISSGAFWLCFRELDSLCAFRVVYSKNRYSVVVIRSIKNIENLS